MKHCLIKQHWNGTPRDKIIIKRDKVVIEGETDIIVSLSLSITPTLVFFLLSGAHDDSKNKRVHSGCGDRPLHSSRDDAMREEEQEKLVAMHDACRSAHLSPPPPPPSLPSQTHHTIPLFVS